MNKFTQLLPFVQDISDDSAGAWKAARIAAGILEARSPRMSGITREMGGNEVANYKCIQRFLEANDPREVLLRMFREDAPFVIGDPTEMPRPQARKTEYVGTLSDGETNGYWLLLLATPIHGRAIPCHFVSYSSKTINHDATSRNQHHFVAFEQVKELLGDKPLVLDREFSYLELLENLAAEGVKVVIAESGPELLRSGRKAGLAQCFQGRNSDPKQSLLQTQGICECHWHLADRLR